VAHRAAGIAPAVGGGGAVGVRSFEGFETRDDAISEVFKVTDDFFAGHGQLY
jgi:hypothetical protein